ncbi:hypothetical protein [Arthrobacter sp. efr-133-TYG-118]|uniref:hypothetical protein n=1 Tax=Arthrobacter sp. efr-133-TYG-118 TaxID=3040279 RepID=UPI00254B0694|nr:hypothetical protein [Arthrobacter sp. efr-133-TYG-118]
MSEVATIQQPGALAAPAVFTQTATATTRNLEAWASELTHAYAIAQTICGTSFVPQHFRGQPEECAAAILYGDTLGLAPMVAVRSIYVVHGTPALYAQAMHAIAISKGHEIERVYADEERVEFRARRRGQQAWQKVEWTIERAKRAKYTSNSKYQENPIGMLTEKCKAEAAKLVAPEALSGLNSVEEIELGDYDNTPLEQVAEAPAKPKRTITRKQQPAPALPPVVKEAPAPVEEPAETPEPDRLFDEITTAQLTKLNIILHEQGLMEREDKLTYLSNYLGRPITSSKELTKQEAHRLIDEHEMEAASR